MIFKPYELQKNLGKQKIFLFYGENTGYKEEIIENIFKKNHIECTYSYNEKEIISNLDNFYNQITSKSFFENKKLIIINEISEKFKDEIDKMLEKNIEDITLILTTGILEKKSKIRSLFEKNNDLGIVAFYKDDNKSLSNIAHTFFKEKKISVSQETINIITEKSSGDRKNLKNELQKIENFIGTEKKLNLEEALKLTNLSENYGIKELVNICLAKDKKKTLKIINENIFSLEDCIILTRSLLISAKRLLKLIEKNNEEKNIDLVISSFRPPIFWKDKEVIKNQLKSWTKDNVKDLISKINEIELIVKKNSNNSLHILFDFLIEQSTKTNNKF